MHLGRVADKNHVLRLDERQVSGVGERALEGREDREVLRGGAGRRLRLPLDELALQNRRAGALGPDIAQLVAAGHLLPLELGGIDHAENVPRLLDHGVTPGLADLFERIAPGDVLQAEPDRPLDLGGNDDVGVRGLRDRGDDLPDVLVVKDELNADRAADGQDSRLVLLYHAPRRLRGVVQGVTPIHVRQLERLDLLVPSREDHEVGTRLLAQVLDDFGEVPLDDVDVDPSVKARHLSGRERSESGQAEADRVEVFDEFHQESFCPTSGR